MDGTFFGFNPTFLGFLFGLAILWAIQAWRNRK